MGIKKEGMSEIGLPELKSTINLKLNGLCLVVNDLRAQVLIGGRGMVSWAGF